MDRASENLSFHSDRRIALDTPTPSVVTQPSASIRAPAANLCTGSEATIGEASPPIQGLSGTDR
jgi:hypothetical protein